MTKRDMRVILILNNYWEWTGGMSEYVAWATGENTPDPTKSKQYTWDDIINFAARFYQIEEAQNRYHKYIDMLVKRVNVYTKKPYKKDATIMAWELANEPPPLKEGKAEDSMQVFEKWIIGTTSFIHFLVPNHLVTTGSKGEKGTLNSWDYTRQAHESKYIDYIPCIYSQRTGDGTRLITREAWTLLHKKPQSI